MRLAALALVVLVTGWGQSLAQDTDPYAAQVKNHDQTALREVKASALDGIAGLYFAYGCKVFATEGQFAALKQKYFMAGHNAMVQYRVLDIHWPDKVASALQNGITRSRSEGCDYWQKNIDEVSDLRRQAKQADRDSLPYYLR